MDRHKKDILKLKEMRESLKTQTRDADKEKIRYLYFDRVLSYENIEKAFNGKYTYQELKSIIKEFYKKY